MANTIRLKRSAVAGKQPATSDLQLGELGLNTYDGKLYTKKSVSGVESIVEIGAAGAAGPIMQTAIVISENVTLNANSRGLSLVDVEVASGYSVTVPSSSTWIVTTAITI